MPQNIRQNFTQYFIMKTSKKRELRQIAFIHSSDIGFMKVYKKCTAKSFSYLLIDTTLQTILYVSEKVF